MNASKQNKSNGLYTEKAVLFNQKLKKWHVSHRRFFPWIGEKNPYKVWLSEIILQQTRVEQGLPYYESYLKYFPTINDLANAEEQLVFRLWQGLGYYNRCKNMIKTARIVAAEYQGIFPNTYEEIIQLPGVGPYTAAAISSFAFNLPRAVVDGNVERFLSRYLGIEEEVNTASGKKVFTQVASDFMDKNTPADFNQAMMDFGATVCMPRQPDCSSCPFNMDCVALEEGTIDKLPVKKKKKKVKKRYLNYFVLRWKDNLYIRKRLAGDIWQNLHDFLLFESNHRLSEKKMKEIAVLQQAIPKGEQPSFVAFFSCVHYLTHQKLYLHFGVIELDKPPCLADDFFPISLKSKDNYAFPRPLVRFLDRMEQL